MGYEWDLDYDGTTFTADVTGTESTATFSAAALDGPASRTVALRVTDRRGAVSPVATALITVNNVAPTVTIAGPSTVNEGSVYKLTLGPVIDPGADAVFAYLIDWGGGTGSHHVPAQNLPADRTLTHVYQDGPASLSISSKSPTRMVLMSAARRRCR